MAWTPWGDVDLIPHTTFNFGSKGHRGANTNVVKDFFDSTAAGIGNIIGGNYASNANAIKPAWQIQSDIDRSVRGTQEADQAIDRINEQNIADLTDQLNANSLTADFDPIAALRAQQASEAAELRNGILGRRGEVDDILAQIIGRLDGILGEAKGKRKTQYDEETTDLVGTLNEAIPDASKAFAALGLTNSTFANDRTDDIRGSYERSYNDTTEQYADDVAEYETNANTQKTNANTQAAKARNAFDTIERTDATADNLQNLQRGRSELEDMLIGFGGERDKLMTSGDALNRIMNVDNDFDFDSVLGAFKSFAGNGAAPAAKGGKAPAGVFDEEKKKKTEVQVNNPVGAASF